MVIAFFLGETMDFYIHPNFEKKMIFNYFTFNQVGEIHPYF